MSKQNAGRSILILQARRCQAGLPKHEDQTRWIPALGSGQSVERDLTSTSEAEGGNLGAGRAEMGKSVACLVISNLKADDGERNILTVMIKLPRRQAHYTFKCQLCPTPRRQAQTSSHSAARP